MRMDESADQWRSELETLVSISVDRRLFEGQASEIVHAGIDQAGMLVYQRN